jgi:ParB family protein of integrating conjugative element (PFGI_1 class)
MSRARASTKRGSSASEGLVLAIDQIAPFAKDPRQSPNAEYARIKASILAQGLDQPLVVTREPGADGYLIAAGGNTRLKILRELHAETGDAKFAQIACVFKPWRGEAEVMLAHLRENDLRGDLTFLDKARAVCDVRVMLESEEGEVSLTQALLTERLRARGYALSQASISNMHYAIEVLAPRLPMALRGGLAHKEVLRIRAFEGAVRGLWNDRIADSDENFDDVFTLLCRRYDSAEWDFVSLRQAFEAEIAERLNQSVHAVRLALEARLNGVTEVSLPRRPEEDEWPEPVVQKPRLPSTGRVPSALDSAPEGDAPPRSPMKTPRAKRWARHSRRCR